MGKISEAFTNFLSDEETRLSEDSARRLIIFTAISFLIGAALGFLWLWPGVAEHLR